MIENQTDATQEPKTQTHSSTVSNFEQSRTQFFDAMKQRLRQRVNLSPIMLSLLEDTFQSSISDQELERTIYEKKDEATSEQLADAKRIWDELKSERNALVALFTEEIWESFSTQRNLVLMGEKQSRKLVQDPWALLNHREGITDPVDFYYTVTKDVFKKAIDDWEEGKTNDSGQTRLDILYQRLRKIITFGRSHSFTKDEYTPGEFIHLGANTMIDVTWALIDVIPKVLKRDGLPMTTEVMVQALERSYGGLVGLLSSMHKDIGVSLLKNLRNSPADYHFNPKFFHVTKELQGYQLQVDHSVFLQATTYDGTLTLDQTHLDATTWCPAKYSQGEEKDVIREAFEWCVEIAKREVFPKLVESYSA